MRRLTLLLLVPVLVITRVSPSFAQDPLPVPEATYRYDVGRMIMGGLGFGALGWLGGGLIGVALWSSCDTEDCWMEGFFYGAAAGGTLGMTNGVHLGNDRRGSFGLDFFTAAAVWGGGVFLAGRLEAQPDESLLLWFAIPVVQLAATISVEQSFAKKRFESDNLSVHLLPGPDRGLALAVWARF